MDYSQPDTITKLHRFVRKIQEFIYHYWGSLTRLTVDDKGTVLLVLFGAPPLSHENNPEHALHSAMDLQAFTQEQELQLAIGITTGRMFAGPVGGDTRREYTVMGDAVNLAARLMVTAGPGNINCSYDVYRHAMNKWRFEALPPMEIKGKVGFIPVYRPLGIYNPTQLKLAYWKEKGEPLLGRQAEAAKLVASLEQVQAGQSRIVIVEGEAGIGKSRLVKSLAEVIFERELPVLVGVGQNMDQAPAYYAWKDIFLALLDLEDDNLNLGEKQQQILTHVKQTAPDLVDYLPLLNNFLGLTFTENRITTPLDEARRNEQLSPLLIHLLHAYAAKQPLTLILEDAQWFDSYSWKLGIQLAIATIQKNIPLLLILVTRPTSDITRRTEIVMLTALAETEHIRLDTLSKDETLAIAGQRMGLTPNDLPDAVVQLLDQRAGGNPYFAEELFYNLHDNGQITFKTMQDKIRCLISGDISRATQSLPTTMQSTILTRIDQLSPEKQLLLKVAAVIGQTFAYSTLIDTLNKHLGIQEGLVKSHLDDLMYLELIRLETTEPDLYYAFKHVIIREVVYQSLLFDRRRQLHRTVAQWYENTYTPQTNGPLSTTPPPVHSNPAFAPRTPSSSSIMPYYSLLVYHWHQAEDEARELHYAARIAEQAVAEFANAEALSYLNRALDLVPKSDLAMRYKLLLLRETVYERYGIRDVQAQDLEMLAELAEQMENSQQIITVALRQANYAKTIGAYDDALAAIYEAITQAEQSKDSTNENQAYIEWGRILISQGNYQLAQEKLEQALELAQANQMSLGEAKSLHYLGVACVCQGLYTKAQDYIQQSLEICNRDDHQIIKANNLNLQGECLYYLDDYAAAHASFEQAIPIYYISGYRQREVRPFNNVGLIHLRRGNYQAARDYFEQTLEIQQTTNDLKGTADTYKDLGITYAKMGDFNAARSYLGHSLEINKELGNRVGEAGTLSTFGYVYFQLGEHETTQRYCNLALDIQQEVGNLEGQSYSLTYLGHAQVGLNLLNKAAKSYEESLRLRRSMGQVGATVDILAGQANLFLLQRNLKQALINVQEILAWTEKHGITGLDNPFWVYLTCYRILQADKSNAEQAQIVLAIAYHLLIEQADYIYDKKAKHAFLNKITIHQEIINAWEKSPILPQQIELNQRETAGDQSAPLSQEALLEMVNSARQQGKVLNLFKANLQGIDLQGVDLRRVYLSHANLRGSDLTGADLSWAYLREADLSGANISRANLSSANLFRANLNQASLNEADLRRTNLRGGDLSQANLHRANLRGANLFRSNFSKADLNEAMMVGANTNGADFSKTNLTNTNITREQLGIIGSLKAATMPDGSKRS